VYPATNRLQDANIDYDAAGNVTRFSMPDSSQRWLTWDALNRMTAAWTAGNQQHGRSGTENGLGLNRSSLMAIDVAVISKDTLECLNKKTGSGAESSNGPGSGGNGTP